MNKSVVIYGWYGPGNVGDELLLSVLLQWARRNALDPVVISYDVAYTKFIHGVKAVDVEDFPAIANAISEAKACILGGGGIFQTHTEFTYAGLFHFDCTDVSTFVRPVILAQKLGVPSVLIGQGVGPLIHKQSREITRNIFDAADAVSVRDKASLDLLKFIGTKRELPMAPDLVWTLPVGDVSNNAQKNNGSKRVAMVIRPWFKAQGFEGRLIAAIKTVLNPRIHTLIWIPFQNHSIPNRSASDKGFIQQCMGSLGPEWHQEIIEVDRPECIIEVISGCDAVVAMRLHAQILAFKLGKPTLSVEYDEKMSELSAQVEQDATLRIRPEDDLQIWQRALERVCNLDTPPGFNLNVVEKLKIDATHHFRLLDKLILQLSNNDDSKRQARLQEINWFEFWLIWVGKKIQARTSQSIVERDGRIASLSQEIVERDGRIASLSHEIAERDGQIARLRQEIIEHDGKISKCNNEMIRIRQSNSWRITSPLRVAKNLVVSPRKTAYSIIRSMFWQLPVSLRQALHGPRHVFVRFVRGLPAPEAYVSDGASNSDISWEQFQKQVLSRRADYKGVFVHELVIDWNVPLYQRPQHMSTALGALGYLVIYRTDNWAGDDVNGFREVSRNVWITNRYEVEEIQDVVRSFYSTAYANTPELLLKKGRRGVLVYEYIDHIDPEISGDRENIDRLLTLKNFAFSGGADFIVASAKVLYEEAVKAVGREKVILVPNGVDTAHYRDPSHQRTSLPSSLIEFKKRYKEVVGYFGALAPWLWYECIEELARMRPDTGFVFIGPDYYGGSSNLPRYGNVLYLGPVDYKNLPAYAVNFDVCFIPFKHGDIAKTTSPLKLFEYFALEKPVVVTACMDECTAYPEVFRGESALELDNAINDALRVKDDPSFLARLRELADQNDWCKRARAYETVFFKRSSLDNIQKLIRDSHRMDGEGKTYYEDAYMAQEMLYWRPVLKWIDDLRDINAVVDVGAAYGTLLSYVAINNGCREVYAIDPVGYMSTSLRNKLGIKLVRMDFEREAIDLPVKFDLVIFTEVIEHLNFHPLPTLIKLKSLLNPGGKLLLTTPDAAEWGRVTDYYSSIDAIPQYDGRESEWIDGHIWQYTKDELEDILDEAGFIVLRFDYSPGVAARHLCYLLSVRS